MEQYVRRGASECLSTAWTLLSTNFKKICKTMWLPALVLSLLTAIWSVFYKDICQHLVSNDITLSDGIWMLVLSICLILADIFFTGNVYSLINEQKKKFCYARVTKALIYLLLVSVIVSIIMIALAVGLALALAACDMGEMMTTGLVMLFVAVMSIIICLLIMPLVYPITKYIIEPEMKLVRVWKYYKMAYKNFGFLLGTLLLMVLIVLVISSIASMPTSIISIVSIISSKGALIGDPSGLPDYFGWLMGIATFVTTLLGCLIKIWETFVEYYVYASIEARNQVLPPLPTDIGGNENPTQNTEI